MPALPAEPPKEDLAVPVTDRVSDWVLRRLIGSVQKRPWEKRIPLMGAVVRRGIGPLAGYRRRAETNLAMIYPDMSGPDRRHIADGVLDNFGRTFIENYSSDEFGQKLKGSPIEGEGMSALETARRDGRPVLFVTGHFGNHEAPRQVLHAMGYEIGGLYRPMKNRPFNEHYARTMTELSGPVFEQGRRGTIGFARHLKQGGMGTLLFDVHDSTGIALPFLGRNAQTSTSAADLALKFDAVVIPYFGIRNPDGLSFTIAVERPIDRNDAPAMMAEMTARLEARVRAHPEQWFWVHRRWKL